MIKYSNKSCLICKSNNKIFLEYVNSSEIKNYFYVICKTCGMMFLDKSFSDKKLEEEYNDIYWEDAENIEMISRMYARGIGIINNIKSYGHTACNILDIGGGIGGVALGMKSKSCNITIIDRSKGARIQAKKFGFRVYKTIEDIQDKLYEFDTIVMCHSLEHFKDPLGFIETIKKLLKPNTLIYIEVPNAKWHISNEIYHETMWTKPLLENFAELNSFEDIKLWSSASPYVASKPIYLHLLARVSNKYNTEFINNNFLSSKYSRILFNIHNKYSDLIDKVSSYSLRKLLSPYHKRQIVGFTNIIKSAQDEIDKYK